MKDTEIRIAIAEACGITGIDAQEWTAFVDGDVVDVPDYPNDLNAMHEAEKDFKSKYSPALSSPQEWDIYRWNLVGIVSGKLAWVEGELKADESDCIDAIDATARQRAEAFLRTIGKWKEQEAKV